MPSIDDTSESGDSFLSHAAEERARIKAARMAVEDVENRLLFSAYDLVAPIIPIINAIRDEIGQEVQDPQEVEKLNRAIDKMRIPVEVAVPTMQAWDFVQKVLHSRQDIDFIENPEDKEKALVDFESELKRARKMYEATSQNIINFVSANIFNEQPQESIPLQGQMETIWDENLLEPTEEEAQLEDDALSLFADAAILRTDIPTNELVERIKGVMRDFGFNPDDYNENDFLSFYEGIGTDKQERLDWFLRKI